MSCRSKNLERLYKIVCILSENKCESFREMLEREELLGGSKGNYIKFFFHFLLKNDFFNINSQHVLNTRFHIVLMLCREQQ